MVLNEYGVQSKEERIKKNLKFQLTEQFIILYLHPV